MAVANTFTFGGVSTTTYSVIVEGAGDYSGAKRAVEMVSIPGRNGAFVLDKGYFENEPVEYDVLIQGATQATFETAVSAFKNAILSKTGYQRLTDTYHPNEYRMAVYSGGFDEEPTFHGKGASFKVKFDCQPQRYLTSGETKQTIANSGDTISNPTYFDAAPLLEATGYGDIEFNGHKIELANTTLGVIELGTSPASANEFVFDESKVNTGDALFFSGTQPSANTYISRNSADVTITDVVGWGNTNCVVGFHKNLPSSCSMTSNPDVSAGFIVGTPSVISWQAKCKLTYAKSGTSYTYYVTADASLSYDGDNKITFNYAITAASNNDITVQFGGGNSRTLSADSTVDTLGNPTYIDCDIGGAYMVKNGSVVSLNQYIDLGSELPKLAPGSNAITFDNTITSLKITPRWWKI